MAEFDACMLRDADTVRVAQPKSAGLIMTAMPLVSRCNEQNTEVDAEVDVGVVRDIDHTDLAIFGNAWPGLAIACG